MVLRLRLPALALVLLALAVGTTKAEVALHCNGKMCIARSGEEHGIPDYAICLNTDPDSGPRTHCIPTRDETDCGWDDCDTH